MKLKRDELFTARIGALVSAMKPMRGESQNSVIILDFPQAERIIAYMIENGSRISKAIARRCADIGLEIATKASLRAAFPDVDIVSSKTERTSHVMTAVDFDEVVVRFKGTHFVVRPSFTVCAAPSGAEQSKLAFSKVWIRIVELDPLLPLRQELGGTFINSTTGFEDIKLLLGRFLKAGVEEYEKTLRIHVEDGLRMESQGTINIFSSDLKTSDFDVLESKMLQHVRADKPRPLGKASATFSQLAQSFLIAANEKGGGFGKLLDNPRAFIEKLRERDTGEEYKVIFIDDTAGVGYYIASVRPDGADFVGVAKAAPTQAFEESSTRIRFRPSKTQANVVSAMLANDLVVGL